MDADRGKLKWVKQTWRAVSTQSSLFKRDDEKDELQSRAKTTHHATSSTNLTAKDGKSMTPEKHSVQMKIGQSLMRFIVGKGGGTQKEIEKETGVKIILPSSRKEESIIIEGNSVESVANASEKIQNIVDKAVNSRALDYSHFISLPLAIHPELVVKLNNFQNTILQVADLKSEKHFTKASIVAELKDKDADAPGKGKLVNYGLKKSETSSSKSHSSELRELGIEKSIFINPKTFHLTILMLKLWNKERVNAAAEVLRSVSSQVMDALDNRPVSIKLKGLDCMTGTFAKARVLYAPVEVVGGEDRLLRAIQVIINAFAEAGLLVGTDGQRKLKLHATLMNAGHSKRNQNSREPYSFDARGVFERYGSEEWGKYLIREAHLSQRFVYDENGYYHCCASIPFPDKK